MPEIGGFLHRSGDKLQGDLDFDTHKATFGNVNLFRLKANEALLQSTGTDTVINIAAGTDMYRAALDFYDTPDPVYATDPRYLSIQVHGKYGGGSDDHCTFYTCDNETSLDNAAKMFEWQCAGSWDGILDVNVHGTTMRLCSSGSEAWAKLCGPSDTEALQLWADIDGVADGALVNLYGVDHGSSPGCAEIWTRSDTSGGFLRVGYYDGSAWRRIAIFNDDGKMYLVGGGSSDTLDSNLYRGGANQIKTDDSLCVGANFGMANVTPQAQQAHIDNPTDLNTCVSVLTTLLADLEGFGFHAVS